MAVTEVNVSLGMVEFCDHTQTSQIEFRKKLAEALIYNEYYNEIEDKTPEKRLRNNEHHLIATAHSPEEKIPQWMNGQHEERLSSAQVHFLHSLHPWLLQVLPRGLPM